MIIKYKNFESSEEFEQWQVENTIEIKMIIPIALNSVINKYEHKDSAINNYGIMVTYIKL